MVVIIDESVENIVGKGENADIQHFLHFPQYFLKPSFSGLLRYEIVWFKKQTLVFRCLQYKSFENTLGI